MSNDPVALKFDAGMKYAKLEYVHVYLVICIHYNNDNLYMYVERLQGRIKCYIHHCVNSSRMFILL